jgi:protein-L-isoaspartate(D-aspartate) O-methyltransferase
MVSEQLVARGIKDPRVLAAMREIDRERFVPPAQAAHAYDDKPLPIGHGQTISQPYIVARMLELAAPRPTDRLLEVGSGSGYALAVAARLCARAWGLEILPALAERAAGALRAVGVKNAEVVCRDGTLGLAEHEPYDVIIVSAGAPRIPVLLLAQLADHGRLVAPVGEREDQRLVVVEREGAEYRTSWATSVRFVDLTGRYGWRAGGLPEA